MTAVEARFYDGKSSQQHKVLIYPDPPARLRVIGDGIDFSCALAEVRPSSRVGNTRRHLYFADGSQCETEDNDAIDAIFSGVRAEAPGRLLHHWESRLSYAAAALCITLFLGWAGITYGLPALAKQVAFGLPAATQTLIGRDALAVLDKVLLAPTQLPAERQTQLRAVFSGVTGGLEEAGDYRLELRAGKRLGPNALALPSGIIVFTDELAELAESDQELIAVLAHEIGHLKQRHALRHLLQNSATALLIAAVVGDITSITSLAAALPTMLLQAKYSRDFETEADAFALGYMQRNGIPPEAFAAILLRMDEKAAAKDAPVYLSTHPATRERAERFRATR
jgi:Zn-dependent protease with chaperone function